MARFILGSIVFMTMLMAWTVWRACRGRCVGMEEKGWGWELAPRDFATYQSRGLEACQRLCMYWSPCLACSFHHATQRCLLSPHYARPLPTHALLGEGWNVTVSVLMDKNDCGGSSQSKNPCRKRPCGDDAICALTEGGKKHTCLPVHDWVAPKPCPPSYTMDPDGCYKTTSKEINWQDARQECSSEGAQLFSLDSTVKSERLEKMLSAVYKETPLYVWLGCSDADTEGDWKWESGVSMDLTTPPWEPDQPDDYNNADCCYLLYPNFTIDDAPCSQTMGGMVCDVV